METKICSGCKELKEICFFHKDKTKKCGLKSRCKRCVFIQNKIYRENNSETISKKRKEYYIINHNKEKNVSKIYRDLNKEKIKEKRKEKYKNDKLHKLRVNVRRRINNFIKNKSKTSFEIVGCTVFELKKFIESKFKIGMCWENYGKFGWHLDHIIPLSSAKTQDELYKLCHYTNLQPLWFEENLSKGNKILK